MVHLVGEVKVDAHVCEPRVLLGDGQPHERHRLFPFLVGHDRIVNEPAGGSSSSISSPAPSSDQANQGSVKAPSWLANAAMSSAAHSSVILPSSFTR